MSFLTRPVEDLLQLLFNRIHGGFLQTPLDSEHLEVSLRDGVHTLHEIEVCPKTVNAQLKDSPVHVTSASIKLLQLQLPSLYRILEDSVIVVVQDAEINLCSADLSGYSVNPKESNREAERSDDDQGVNLLTNFIGNILSNIEISVTRLTVNLRASPDSPNFLSIQFPVIKYEASLKGSSDEHNKKLLTFKQMNISYVEPEHEHLEDYQVLFRMTKPLKVAINFTRVKLSASLSYDSLQFILSRAQCIAVLGVLSQLKPTTFIQQEDSDLGSLQLRDEIKETLQPKLKDRKLKLRVQLRCISVVVGLEAMSPFSKVVSECEPNQHFPGSHLVFQLNDVVLRKNASLSSNHTDPIALKEPKPQSSELPQGSGRLWERGRCDSTMSFTALGMSVSSHILTSQPSSAVSSSMFYSTNSMINSDFLRRSKSILAWELDLTREHFCSNYLLTASPRRPDKQDEANPAGRYAICIEMASSELKIATSAIEINVAEAVLTRLLEFDLSLPPQSVEKAQENSIDIEVLVPALAVTYQQTEGSCGCEGVKRRLKFSCNTIDCKQSGDLNISLTNNCLRMILDEDTTQVLAYNTRLDIRLEHELQWFDVKEEPNSPQIHDEYEHGQGLITIPANLVLDERVNPFANAICFKQDYDKWRPSLSKMQATMAKVMHVDIQDVKLKADTHTVANLQLFRFPKAQDSSSPSDSSLVVKANIGLITVSLLDAEQSPPQSHELSASSFAPRSTDELRIEQFKLLLKAATLQIFKLPDAETMLKLDLMKAELVSNLTTSSLFETDRRSQFISLTFSKTHKQDLDVTLLNGCLHLEDLQPLVEYLSRIQVKPTPASDQAITSIHVKFCNLSMSFAQPVATLVCGVDQLEVWFALMNSSPSQAVNVDLKSIRLELADGFVETGASFEKPKSSFIELICIESTQLFLSLSEHSVDPPKGLEESHILDCELGDCSPVLPYVFVSNSQLSLSQDQWRTFHLNVGSIFMHCCKDSLDLISRLAALVKLDSSEENEVIRKDSDLSSDDAFDFEVCRDGLLIEPENPDRISNFSLLDYLALKPPPLYPKLAQPKTKPTRVIHCHPEIPMNFSALNQSLHSLKSAHGQPSLKISIVLSYFSFNFYGGNDFKNASGLRRSQDCIRMKISKVIAAFCKFPTSFLKPICVLKLKQLHYNWRLTCSVEELEIRDFVRHSTVDKLLHPLQPETLLTVSVSSVFTQPQISSQSELVVAVRLLPIKLTIDQHLIRFLLELTNLRPRRPEMMGSIGGPPRVFAKSTASFYKEPEVSKRSLYVQRLEVDYTEFRIDYIPHSSSMDGLPFSANALGVLPSIETIRLTFPRTVIRAVSDPSEAMLLLKDVYQAHIMSNEVGEILKMMTPINSFYNFAEAAYNLAVSPYQVGLYGVRAALISFVKVGSLESLRIMNGIFSSFYGIIQAAGGMAGFSLPSRQRILKPLYEMQKALKGR